MVDKLQVKGARAMRKIVLISIAACALLAKNVDATAALHPYTTDIIKAITNAPDAYQVQEALCGKERLLREKGRLAGEKCRFPAFALIFTVGCSNYPGADDSKCHKNAQQALATTSSKNGMPVDAVKVLIEAAQTQGTNAQAILCTPPREKLPGKLKIVADEACKMSKNAVTSPQLKVAPLAPSGRAFRLLIPSQAKMIEDLERDKMFLEKVQKPLARMPQEILARSARDVNKDLGDLLQKISSYLNQTSSSETLSSDDVMQGQGHLLQSESFIKKLETMGIRVNPTTGNVEKLIYRWEVVR